MQYNPTKNKWFGIVLTQLLLLVIHNKSDRLNIK